MKNVPVKPGLVSFLLDLSYGSSSKAQVCMALADRYVPDILIANHSTSSSHTAVVDDNEFVFKVLPSASMVAKLREDYNPVIVISPSSGFDIAQLKKEIEYCGLDKQHVLIHHRAVVVTPDHGKQELENMGGVNHLGSTLSGQSVAFSGKMSRNKTFKYAGEYDEIHDIATVLDGVKFSSAITGMLHEGASALYEIPQGVPLSLDYSNEPRLSTFRNISPMQALSDIGVNHEYFGPVIGNMRVYPIRVSNRYKDNNMDGVTLTVKYPDVGEEIRTPEELGMTYSDVNAIVYDVVHKRTPTQPYGFEFVVTDISGVEGVSGSFESDLKEVSWREMSAHVGQPLEEETTLTKLPRRIAVPTTEHISMELMDKAMLLVKPDFVSFTFLNYVLKNIDPGKEGDELSKWVSEVTKQLLKRYGSNSPDILLAQYGRDLHNIAYVK